MKNLILIVFSLFSLSVFSQSINSEDIFGSMCFPYYKGGKNKIYKDMNKYLRFDKSINEPCSIIFDFNDAAEVISIRMGRGKSNIKADTILPMIPDKLQNWKYKCDSSKKKMEVVKHMMYKVRIENGEVFKRN